MLTYLFRWLKKTPLTVYFYSWFIYKVCMGLITGMSAFVLSSFSLALLAAFLAVMFARLARAWLDISVSGPLTNSPAPL